MNQRTPRLDRDVWVGAAIMLVSAGTGVAAWQMPRFVGRGSIYTAPGLTPGVMSAIIFIIAAVIFLRGVRRTLRKRDITGFAQWSAAARRRVTGTVLLTGIYALWIFRTVPFIAGAMGFLFVLALMLRATDGDDWRSARILSVAAISSLLISVSVYVLFKEVFFVGL